MKLCNRCKVMPRTVAGRYCLPCNAERGRSYYHSLRKQMHEEYGNTCARCGSKEKLQLHHLNYNGLQHRVLIGRSKNGPPLESLKRLGWPTRGEYACQLLCRPCHKQEHFGEGKPGRQQKTFFCPHGHPLNAIQRDGKVYCGECKRLKCRKYYWKNREKILAKLSSLKGVK